VLLKLFAKWGATKVSNGIITHPLHTHTHTYMSCHFNTSGVKGKREIGWEKNCNWSESQRQNQNSNQNSNPNQRVEVGS